MPNVIRLFIGELTEGPPRAHAHPAHAHPHEHGYPHEHGHEHRHEHDHRHNEDEDANEDNSHSHPHHHPHTEPSHNHPHAHSDDNTLSCLDVDRLKVLETNIDDLNPESYGYIMDKLFDIGALDVFFIPIQMKKNRPAILLRVLCRPDDVTAMTEILFRETSTLGIREQTVDRHALSRRVDPVPTPYGEVHVKVATLPDGSFKHAPEYEDCRHLAEQHAVPLREIYQVAIEAARRTFGG